MAMLCLRSDEVLDAINSLDMYSRIWVGQFDHIDLALHMWRFSAYTESCESRICEDLLMGMRSLFLPEMAGRGQGASLGIWNDKVNELAVCAYDMQQVIRHDWSWFENPEGNRMSRWFDEPYLRGSLPVPSTKCHTDEDGSSTMQLSVEAPSLRLLLDAVLACKHLLDLRIVALMRLYTRDGRVLTMAQMIEDILREASISTYERFDEHEKRLGCLVAKVADLAMCDIEEGYRSLALERADNGEPLTYRERRKAQQA